AKRRRATHVQRYDCYVRQSSLSRRAQRPGSRWRTAHYPASGGSGIEGIFGGALCRARHTGPAGRRAQWLSAGAGSADGDWVGEGASAEDARSCWRGSVLSLGAVAAVPEEGEAARGGAAVAVPEGCVDER